MLSSHYLPPFKREFSETRRWSADDWQALPFMDPENLDDLPSTLMVGKDDHHDEDQGSEREQIGRSLYTYVHRNNTAAGHASPLS